MHPIVNTANLNALGACLLSLAMGAPLGTALFFLAILIGTFNKISLGPVKGSAFNLVAVLKAPTFTAWILTIASLWNSLDAIWSLCSLEQQNFYLIVFFLALLIAWGAGFVGDIILILVDMINYPHVSSVGVVEKWRAQLQNLPPVFFNPAVMYSFSAFGFVLATLVDPLQGSGQQSTLFVFVCLMALSAAVCAIFSSVTKMLDAVGFSPQGGFARLLTHEMSTNYLLACSNSLFMLSATISENYIVALAQFFFVVSCFSMIFEARGAAKSSMLH